VKPEAPTKNNARINDHVRGKLTGRCPDFPVAGNISSLGTTVDGSEIRRENHLRLVLFQIMSKVYIFQVVVWDF